MKSLRLALISIIATILIAVSCGSPTATPTGTVNAYLDAIIAQDAEKLVSYELENLDGRTPARRVETYESVFQSIKSYSISNRNLVVESETDTTATVSTSFDLFTTYTDDRTDDQAVDHTYYLTKVDGKWLISDESGGRGEVEARKTERHAINTAVAAMMADSNIGHIPNPVTTPANDMTIFPDVLSDSDDGPDANSIADKATDPNGHSYTYPGDKKGYILWDHDNRAEGDQSNLERYCYERYTTYYYTIDEDATLHQWDAPGGTEYID